jgi:hypothetical protein
MTALRNVLAFNGPMPAVPALPAFARQVPAMLRNMALFLASPFIGLAYAVLLPFVGIGMLLWIATEGLRKPARTAPAGTEAPVAVAEPMAEVPQAIVAQEEAPAHGLAGAAVFTLKLLAAPLAGLAFVVVMPFLALGALAWAGIKAIRTA